MTYIYIYIFAIVISLGGYYHYHVVSGKMTNEHLMKQCISLRSIQLSGSFWEHATTYFIPNNRASSIIDGDTARSPPRYLVEKRSDI